MAILGGWVFGAEGLRRYLNDISDWQVGRWWNVAIKWVVPMVLAILLATQLSKDLRTPYEGYPAWATVLVPLALGLIMGRGQREAVAEVVAQAEEISPPSGQGPDGRWE